MASILADAIMQKHRILIIGDYDTDGATSTAVGVRALKMMGADVDYLVPNRFEFGYGLTPEIVDLAKEKILKLLLLWITALRALKVWIEQIFMALMS